jgi:hypothetical protein
MTKFKKRKEEQEVKDEKDRFNKIFKKSKKKFKKETSSLGGSSDDSPPSPTESQHSDDYDDGLFQKKFFSYTTRAQQQVLKRKEAELKAAKRKRKNPHPIKVSCWPANYFNLFSDVISDDSWCQKSTCCGSIYECKDLESVIINVASFKPCQQHQGKDLHTTKIQPPPQHQVVPQHTTAIKKHQLFLKRHSEPSSVAKLSLSDISSNSIVTEFSNNNDKTEPMDSTDERKEKDNIIPQMIDIKFKTIHNDEKKNGNNSFHVLIQHVGGNSLIVK